MRTDTYLRKGCLFVGAALLSLAATRAADVTQPGDVIFASSANSPGSEGVANAIDNKTTKYLNFDSGRDGAVNGFSPSGFVVIPAIGATHVTGMTIQAANDSPERDPKAVTLEGSNDDNITGYNTGNWESIATLDFPAFANRFDTHTLTFANNKAYKAYRWTVTQTASANTCCMQVAEVELLGEALPQDVTQPGDPLVASSANSPGSEGVANAIDNKTTKYLNFDSGRDGAVNGFSPSGFVVTPSIGRTLVTGMIIQAANDSPERDPKTVVLEGSNDENITTFSGGNWEQITTLDVPTFAARFASQTFLFDNVKPYRSYRWTVNATASANTCCMQVAEVSLLGTGAPVDVTQPGDPIIASSANSPGSEGVANVIDNKTTKYLNFDSGRDGAVNGFSPSGFVVTPSVGATKVIGMTIQAANDSPERDPKTVTLEGSNDDSITSFSGGNWESVATITTATFANRFDKQEFYFSNNKEYKSYRWTVTATASANTCCMQVAEVELLAVTTSAPASARFLAQPENTPVILGQPATFYVTLNGPWPLQWYKNGVAIPGATKTSYTTEAVTADNATNVYTAQIVGREASTPVQAIVFAPSSTKSVAVSFMGSGANGAPTTVNTNSVIGVFPQAYWNNAPSTLTDLPGEVSTDVLDADGNVIDTVITPYPVYDSDGKDSSITISWGAGGTWGAGTGVEEPTDRMLNGIFGNNNTTQDPATVTFHNVPAGKHAVLIYAVAPPLHVQTIDYSIDTQHYYMRVLNSDEYNAAPGFYRSVSTDANNPGLGDFIRFDNVQPDGNGDVTISALALRNSDQRVGYNGVQLLLNAPAVGNPPAITTQPQSAVAASGGTVRLSVAATGTGLTYQWRKNGRNLPNGGNVSGSDTPTLAISNFGDADAGVYSVAVFSPAGSVVSANAALNLSKFDIADAELVYLPFDASSGTTVANSAPGGQAGTVSGTATWGAGKINNSLAFDGLTYVNVPNFTKPTKLMGVSLWVNADAGLFSTASFVRNAAGGLAVGGVNAGLFDFGLVLDDTDGGLHLQAQVAVGPNIITVKDPAIFTQDAWHQVAFTLDGAQLHLYKDGQEVAATPYSLDLLNTPAIKFLTVGGRVDVDATTGDQTLDGATAFVGKIDDLAIWGRPLTLTEVAAINTAGNQGKAVSTVTLEAPPNDEPPTLALARSGSTLTLSWSGSGFKLQSADTVAGQYTDVQGVTGTSATVNIDANAKAKFYRLVK